jgi:hypothetical protein
MRIQLVQRVQGVQGERRVRSCVCGHRPVNCRGLCECLAHSSGRLHAPGAGSLIELKVASSLFSGVCEVNRTSLHAHNQRSEARWSQPSRHTTRCCVQTEPDRARSEPQWRGEQPQNPSFHTLTH